MHPVPVDHQIEPIGTVRDPLEEKETERLRHIREKLLDIFRDLEDAFCKNCILEKFHRLAKAFQRGKEAF